MRRGSVIGPVLLIVIGVVFLIHNLNPEFPILRLAGDYWPWLLIGWGAVRLAEITIWHFGGKPLPLRGISGGEWALIVFLCMLGSSVFHVQRDGGPFSRIRLGGIDILGETHDFPLTEQKAAAGKAPRILIENARGDARVMGGDGEEVKVNGRTMVRALSEGEAAELAKKCPLELVKQGDVYVIRTNQERISSRNTRISSDIEITVPRGATVEGRGRYGDFEVSDITGSVTIDSDNAGVRVSNIGGNVKVQKRRGDIVRAMNVKGSVEISGRGGDVDLESIEGPVTVNGEFFGDLQFRRLSKPLRFESSQTELRVARTPGEVSVARGHLSANMITGPVFLRAKSKDVEVSNFTDTMEVALDRGDITVHPGAGPLARMTLRTKAGDVELYVPPSAKFQVKAETRRGEIDHAFGDKLTAKHDGRGQTIEGGVGTAGPQITISTDRGDIGLRPDDAPPPPPAPPLPPEMPPSPKGFPAVPKPPKPPSVTEL